MTAMRLFHTVRRARIALLLLLALTAGSVCAAPRGAVPAPATLYQQLGGQRGVAAITQSMLDGFAGDPRVRPFFERVDIRRFSEQFEVFICQVADGPCRYRGQSLASVHQGMNIHAGQFNAVVENLIQAMTVQHIPVRVQNRLLARLAKMRGEVVHH